jgi:uncharacterized protein GlcG (DUF336 family)
MTRQNTSRGPATHQTPLAHTHWLQSIIVSLLLAGCSGGGGDGASDSDGTPVATSTSSSASASASSQVAGCTGSCANATTLLSIANVQTVIAQAAAEANAQGMQATIAVVDRVGNVLGVFRMAGASPTATISSARIPLVQGGLENIAVIPDTLAAIAKAITGAYLSTEGNAFTSRSANQIIQEHFNPGEFNQPAGPLFGVQFSQLPCSDFAARFGAAGAGINIAPQRSPLGLSADPGGLPLYMDGTPVGGIGVIADGIYGLDLEIGDIDTDIDELIAIAGTVGFQPPVDRRGDRITADGKTFRFTDVDEDDLINDPATAPAFATLAGALQTVAGYTLGPVIAGTAFGQPASGIRADTLDYPGLDAFVLVDDTDTELFRPTAGTDGLLTANEVQEILGSGLDIANRARAQIRRPAGTPARVSIAVVDTNGAILGVVRTRDAPMFGTDVAVQKARTAAFFSNANAAADLISAPDAIYVDANGAPSGTTVVIGDYVTAVRTFLAQPTALADGAFAFSDRAGGNMARPYFPDGIVSAPHGPFSKPFSQWSPFADGLQLDLVYNEILTHVLFVLGAGPDTAMDCANIAPAPGRTPLANGIQIFPGSVPIYRDNTLIGGIGVSGDGVDQDDLISFLGLHNAGVSLGTVNNAPEPMRASNIVVPSAGVNLRFVQCPQAPFLDSDEQNVCSGK